MERKPPQFPRWTSSGESQDHTCGFNRIVVSWATRKGAVWLETQWVHSSGKKKGKWDCSLSGASVWRKHSGKTGSEEPAASLSPSAPGLMAANCRKTSRQSLCTSMGEGWIIVSSKTGVKWGDNWRDLFICPRATVRLITCQVTFYIEKNFKSWLEVNPRFIGDTTFQLHFTYFKDKNPISLFRGYSKIIIQKLFFMLSQTVSLLLNLLSLHYSYSVNGDTR